MQLIIISSGKTKLRQCHLSPLILVLLSMMALTLSLLSAYALHHYVIKKSTSVEVNDTVKLADNKQQQWQTQPESSHIYYAKRLGELQAKALRLEALTEKLAEMGGLDIEAIGLETKLGRGGTYPVQQIDMTRADFTLAFDAIDDGFQSQNQILSQLQDYLILDETIRSAIPSGRPIKQGWISSHYGYRADPFTGKKTFHHGVDFAGREGSEVVAVADGVVSWRGRGNGYGKMIELDHGNGYQTRYAHNKALLVELGTRVEQGEAIATMGSTGRSTGPHVHFEVIHNGKSVNPHQFIKNK